MTKSKQRRAYITTIEMSFDIPLQATVDKNGDHIISKDLAGLLNNFQSSGIPINPIGSLKNVEFNTGSEIPYRAGIPLLFNLTNGESKVVGYHILTQFNGIVRIEESEKIRGLKCTLRQYSEDRIIGNFDTYSQEVEKMLTNFYGKLLRRKV